MFGRWSFRRGARRKQVHLVLIRPSNYDDDGYVVRYLRGILPSNTLGCLATLTHQVLRDGMLNSIDLRLTLIDETVMRVDCREIARRQSNRCQVIACLAGVQSNQFPRAADLAKMLRRYGVTVLIGGFHVSGRLYADLPLPADMQELLDAGVTLVKGEVEGTWGQLLTDCISGRLKPMYDFLNIRPDLDNAPIPQIPQAHLRHFVSANFGAIDCGRGCPFNCSFCSVIAVQGRKMRFRSPERIRDSIRENYHQSKVSFYFLTDDNFSRNRHWEAIFDSMIMLREQEGIPLHFMMQVDAQSYRIPGFVEKALRAGCTQVFVGMESMNSANLKAVGKSQNNLEDYRRLIHVYRNAGITVHAGYILGLPYDTGESLRMDIRCLMEDIQVDQVSFFILTPLPGSRDHYELLRSEAYMESDYNHYEYFHETMDYPGFPEKGSLVDACLDAWQEFYCFSNLQRILERTPVSLYWETFRNFLWYKHSVVIDKRHPMMSGYFRRRSRLDIRPGLQPLPRLVFLKRRTVEVAQVLGGYLALILEMQLLWLCTRHRLQPYSTSSSDKQPFSTVRKNSSAISSFWFRWNPFSISEQFYPATQIIHFWQTTLHHLRQRNWGEISTGRILQRLLLDGKVTIHFALAACQQMSGFFRTFVPWNGARSFPQTKAIRYPSTSHPST